MQMAAALNFAAGALRALQPKAGDRSLDGVDLPAEDHAISINIDDRRRAGFTQAEIADLIRMDASESELVEG